MPATLASPANDLAPGGGGARFTAPRGTWLRGHLGAFFADKLGFLERCAREHGDVVPLRFGPVRAWLVSDPGLIGEALTTRAGSFRKSIGLRRAKVLIGEGLLSSEGEVHARRSRIAQPAFRAAEVERYASAMAELTDTVASRWADGARIDLATEMSSLTLAAVARTLFGADLLADAPGIGLALTQALALFEHRLQAFVPLPLWIPTAENRRFRRALAVLDEAVYGMIRRRRAELARGAGADAGDLLSRLMAPSAAGDAPLGDRELRDEVMTLFLAGHETTASGLAFTFRLLAENPAFARRLRAEVDSVCGERPPGAAEIARLPLTAAAFAEAIRLYPPAWILARQATERLVLGGRAPVRKGQLVLMSPFVVHRDARWFPDPAAFRPEERFGPGAPRPLPHTYWPFGIGKRACIGRSFASLEAAILIPTILRRVDLEIDATRPLELLPQITLRARCGVPAVVRRRDPRA